VCVQCKARGNPCVMVAHGTACLGPVTQGGCNALCPAYNRGCYGCFGPMESPNTSALAAQFSILGLEDDVIAKAFRSYSGWSEPFRHEANLHSPNDVAVAFGSPTGDV